MANQEFDPNGVGIANGNIFGFPVTEAEANIVIVPVPWDATASYGKGTSDGPQAILDASTQLDFYHHRIPQAWNTKVYMSPISQEMKEINDVLCEQGKEYIAFLEKGGKLDANSTFNATLDAINDTHNELLKNLKSKCLDLISNGKIPAVLGGEHSTPLGLIQALDEQQQEFGILQIDAHADLRDAYEGFKQSHASIMHNVLHTTTHMKKLVQVGIRDVAASEVQLINESDRVITFFDWEIKKRQFNGENWSQIVKSIIAQLPKRVYISFDIDGLKPSLCPNTGTPVVGGFDLEEINYLFFELVEAGHQIIGFDLNEVSPGENGDWDANVGARALWNLVCAAEMSRKLNYSN